MHSDACVLLFSQNHVLFSVLHAMVMPFPDRHLAEHGILLCLQKELIILNDMFASVWDVKRQSKPVPFYTKKTGKTASPHHDNLKEPHTSKSAQRLEHYNLKK